MSVDGETTKTGASEGKVTPSVQLSECSAACNSLSIMAEVSLGAAARSEMAAAYPAQASLALPNRAGSTDTCSNSEGAEKKAAQNESHINRRNSLHPSKQQQRLSKRRNTSNYGFKHSTSGKRRRRANSESDSVLPSNFLLGGNIFDPLNLNSLLDEEVNRALNAETPKSSPLPAKSRDPVEILIPRDITDPLNLNSGIADSSFLVYPLKSGGRRRNRNRHHGCGGGGGAGGGGGGLSASHPNLTEAGKGGEVKTSGSALKPGALSSCSVPDVPGEPAALSGVGGGEAHDSKDADSAGCREEATVSASGQTKSAEDITSPAPNQHSGRRRRRRNSSKMEPAAAQCVSVRKHVPAERGPGMGPRAGQGARQPQQSYNHQSYNQHKQQQSRKFQYGNYNQYYGYRNPGTNEDPRISVLRPEWFQGKDVLDLGCNSGHLTLYIAKVLRPARILGLDIDSGLVHAARKNIRHYLSALQTEEARRTTQGGKSTEGEERDGNQQLVAAADKQDKHKQAESRDENGEHAKGVSNPSETPKDNVSCRAEDADTGDRDDTTEKSVPDGCGVLPADCSFPVSLRITRGPIAAPPLTEKPAPAPGEFPSNVSFIKANYVLESDELLLTQRPEYDVILCLSVTKWVHLNWGDRGLKRLFQRVYRHLRPGGIFILEPQPWESYARRKKLTDSISKNFNSICLKPEQFSTYLTNKVGFSSYEFIATPKSSMKGFQRPIYLYHK